MHLSCKHLLCQRFMPSRVISEGLSFLHEKVLQLAAYLLPPYGRLGFFLFAFSLPHCTRRVFCFNHKKFFFLFNFGIRRKLLRTWLLTSLWCDCCSAFRFSCNQLLFNQIRNLKWFTVASVVGERSGFVKNRIRLFVMSIECGHCFFQQDPRIYCFGEVVGWLDQVHRCQHGLAITACGLIPVQEIELTRHENWICATLSWILFYEKHLEENCWKVFFFFKLQSKTFVFLLQQSLLELLPWNRDQIRDLWVREEN